MTPLHHSLENSRPAPRGPPSSRARLGGGGWTPGASITWAVVAAALSLLTAPVALAEEAPTEPAELKNLRMEYQQRLLKVRAPADDWYRMQLRAQLPRYQKAGNLDVALLLQAELADPDPDRTPPADKPFPAELAGIRSTYVMQAQRLTAPVRDWYRQQLQLLERSLTQQGDLAGAKTVRAVLETLASPSARPAVAPPVAGTAPAGEPIWSAPLGGAVKGDGKSARLKGPGRGHGPLEIAMAFMRGELPKDFRVAGRFRISGNAGGFVLGRNEDDCLTVYWSRGTSWAVQHAGPDRRIVDRPALAWNPESWQEFELRRQGYDLTVKVDNSVAVIRLPKGIGRWQFGVLTVYQPSEMEVKDLVIGGAQEVGR